MPIVCSYNFSGIPGLVVAAPECYFFDVAYAAKQIKEAHHIEMLLPNREQIAEAAHAHAELWWAHHKPWWTMPL